LSETILFGLLARR